MSVEQRVFEAGRQRWRNCKTAGQTAALLEELRGLVQDVHAELISEQEAVQLAKGAL